MDYTRLVAFMNKFNNDAYKLVDVENQQTSTSDAAGTATEHYRNLINPAGYSHVYGKLYPYDPGVGGVAPYRYKSGDVYKEVGFYLINVKDFADPDGHTYEGFIGPMCTKDVANGRERIFAVKGGGKDDTPANVEMQFVCEAMLVEDIFKPIQKALGIKLLDDVSQEAKDWVRLYQNVENMHNGYEEIINGVTFEHGPFFFPPFETVADNIYVRMCINDSNVVEDFFKSTTNAAIIGKNEDGEPITNGCWVNCYIDPYEGKTYFPYDLVQLFCNTINTCDGFRTSEPSIYGYDLHLGVYPTENKHIHTDDIGYEQAYNLLNAKAAGRPTIINSFLYDRDYFHFQIWCSNNGKIGRTYDGQMYRWFNDGNGTSSWTRYTVDGTRSGYDIEYTITNDKAVTGTIHEIDSTYTNYILSGGGSNLVIKKNSESIGTLPAQPSNIEHSYPAWYNAKADLESLRVVSLGEGHYNVETLTESLLPMSIGEDAGAGKTQTDVHGGNTRAEDLDGGTSDGSNKSIIEDKGETDNSSIPNVVGIGSGIYHVYATRAGVLDSLYKAMYTNQNLGNVVAKLYSSDLTKALVDVYRLPFNVLNSGSDTTSIKVADISYKAEGGAVVAKEYTNRIKTLNFGSLEIKPKFKDQRDYSPITRCTLFLPFSGYHEISIDDIINSEITLEAKIDIISGSGSYNLFVARDDMNALMYTFSFNCRADFPLTGETHRTFIDTMLGLAKYTAGASVGSAAGGALGMIAGGASIMGAATLAKPITYHGGNIGSIGGWLSILTPFIMIDRPNYGEPERFREIMGIAANTDVRLGLVHGYTEVREVHVDSIDDATAWEKDEIARLLKSGVIL